MANVERIVRAMMAAVDSGDMETAASYLSEDFVFRGPVPRAMSKEQWIGMQQQLLAAFPDWSFNLSDVQVEGSVATTTRQITGTHTGELDLEPMGIPTVPATGKSIRLPVEHAHCTVRDGKIVRIEINPNPEGGVPGTLRQLGVDVPLSGG